MKKLSQPPEGYIWRKYQLAVPIYLPHRSGPLPEDGAYYLWPAADENNHPHLNRWEGLEDAFLGFCSNGPVVECVCYDMRRALEAIHGKGLYRTHNAGIDGAELVEHFRENFLGVSFGSKTPCFFSVSSDFDSVMRLFLESVS